MASGSAKAVYTAIVSNSIITVTKIGAFALTGSGAMLSEGIHSFADVCNQVLLAMGIHKARREPDADHPYGYGRDAFVWAMISAVGIFFLGCGVTVYHGVSTLLHPHPIAGIGIALGVLAFSFLLEGYTLWVAIKAIQQAARESNMSFREYVSRGSDPMAVAVLMEDAAAILGVIIASVAIGLMAWTGNPIFDAIGSILIGLLLGVVAVFLVVKNRSSLIGQAVAPEAQARVLAVLESDPVVEGVHDVKAEVLGADHFRFKAEVDFDGTEVARRWLQDKDIAALINEVAGDPETFHAFLVDYGEHIVEALGDEIDRIEERIRTSVPAARHVDLETD